MKTSLLAVGLVILFAAGSESLAGDKSKSEAKAAAKQKTAQCCAAKAQKTEHVYITGSYIKQPITRTGLITDGCSQVIVIDRRAIETSGAGDLRQVLLRYGYSGRR